MVAFLPILSLLVLQVASLSHAANLLVIQAGVKSPKAAVLSAGFTFCPSSFSNTGISVRCQGSDLKAPISLYVNHNKVRVENFSPYTIAGDSAGKSARWNPPGGQVTLSCTSPSSAKVSVTGSFSCATANPQPKKNTPQRKPQPNPQPNPQPQPPAPGKITGEFQMINVQGLKPTKRHEGGSVFARGKVYVMGGRRRQAMFAFDPATTKWTSLGFPPVTEMHHFQAVAIGDNIYIPGAWYGGYPNEKQHEKMWVYNIPSKKWTTALNPPGIRNRGGGAVAVYNGKIYMGAGSSGGHGPSTTLRPFFDVYDPANPTAGWKPLPNVPHMRDHVHGAVVGNQFCIGGGRRGNEAKFLEFPVLPIDCYNFNIGKWAVLKSLPKEHGRSGVGVTSCKGKLLIAGGESPTKATDRVTVFDPVSNTFDPPKFMKARRHGIGAVYGGGKVYAACGAGHRGAVPELNSIESLTC